MKSPIRTRAVMRTQHCADASTFDPPTVTFQTTNADNTLVLSPFTHVQVISSWFYSIQSGVGGKKENKNKNNNTADEFGSIVFLCAQVVRSTYLQQKTHTFENVIRVKEGIKREK